MSLSLPRPTPYARQRVDLFSKDYLFVPVHVDGLAHWSLAVVCHPGRLAGAGAGAGQGADCAADGVGRAVMLHLDSLEGERAIG